MKIGIIRERKQPADRRVPFTPDQCRYIHENFENLEVVVQPSPVRCFRDEEYSAQGIPMQEDLSGCDVLVGIKEVPVDDLLSGKTYFFFSHTVKKQFHNRRLLQEIVKKQIQLVDYELLTDKNGMRIIGFGHFAGLVGVYNGFRALGIRNGTFTLKPAYMCHDIREMTAQLGAVKLPPVKIALTGGGRVAGGVTELLKVAGIPQLSVEEYLAAHEVSAPVFVQLNPGDYNVHREGRPFDLLHFYNHPAEYAGNFLRFIPTTDLLIGAAYWNPAAPVLFTLQETSSPGFRISVIADITCDINGSIPTTRKASSIDEPFYDFNPVNHQMEPPFSNPANITVMAVDNLPCELPKDASADFGEKLTEKVLPALAGEDPDRIIDRATITRQGRLTEKFSYLQGFLEGRE